MRPPHRTKYVVDGLGFAGKLVNFGGANAIATKKLDIAHAQLLNLPQHRGSLSIHTTIKNGVRLFGLDLSQDGHEVGCLVVGELLADHFQAVFLGKHRQIPLRDPGHKRSGRQSQQRA